VSIFLDQRNPNAASTKRNREASAAGGISARRLAIAEQVALAKWASDATVEDRPREADVVVSPVKVGKSRSLDRTFVANFFKDQIEVNKVIQYSLLAAWHRVGREPAHRPIDLASAIRRELDNHKHWIVHCGSAEQSSRSDVFGLD